MILINEFLPNPVGSDADGEWLELWNAGDESVDLNGWRVATEGGKQHSLSGSLSAGEYLVVARKDSKLTLRNGDGGLRLYNAHGKLADEVFFYGVAPEGKSFSRFGQRSNADGQMFIFAEPTPGTENSLVGAVPVVHNQYALGASLNPSFGTAELFGTIVGVAAVFAAIMIVILARNENLSQLFFGKD